LNDGYEAEAIAFLKRYGVWFGGDEGDLMNLEHAKAWLALRDREDRDILTALRQ